MSTPANVELEFSDGEHVRMVCSSDTTIFDAAKGAGVTLAHDCLNGTCGTCRCTLDEGAVDYDVSRDDLALSADEPASVLVCRAKPQSDAVRITLPYTRASLLPEKKRKLRVVSKRRVSESVWEIRCKADGLRMFDFLPGQYVRVTPAGRDFTRAYSPFTVPGSGEIGFLIRELADGAMSTYLRESAVENDVWAVSGPYGIFYRRHTQAPSLYIAGGTGLAPVLSMLQAQKQLEISTGPKKVIFGVTRSNDLFYMDELRALASEMFDTSIVVTVVDGASDPSVQKAGVVDALTIEDFTVLGQDGAAYLCGPPGMVTAIREKAAYWSVPTDRIFAEEFLPS